MKKTLSLCFLLLVLRSGMVAQPTAITYQGKLLDAGGNAITQNNVAMNFAMFDASTGGNLLWPASGTVSKTVDIAQGLYSVQLGTGVSGDPVFTASMFNGKTPWLEVKAGTSTLSRTPFTNVPFALISNELGALGWASPGAMGSTTPNTGKFTTLRADTVTAATFNGELKGNAATASSLKGGANGALPYQSGAGATTMLAAGADGNVLTLASGVPSWAMPLRNAVTVATTANPAPTGNYARNEYHLTALAEAAAFAAPSGTPANGNTLLIRINDNGTARSLTWNAVYTGFSEALPLTTLGGKNMYCRFIFNSTSARWELASLFIQGSCSPSTPVEGTHTPSGPQIIWKWNSVPGATGYKWGTTNDFIAAADMSTDTVKTEAGLNPLTPYTRYVWAYNSCGNSAPVTLKETTLFCGVTLTVNHQTTGGVAPVNKTTTYGTVTDIPGEASKCWITSNLGSGHQASAVDDDSEESAGWYWQFNRKQGYKHDGTTRTPGSNWIDYISENSDWQPTNDPCKLELGAVWRLPTSSEWSNVYIAGSWSNWGGPWNSGLKLHAAGYLYFSDGSLFYRGAEGNYWSRAQASTDNGWGLYFFSSGGGMGYIAKENGFSVRCLRD